MGFYSLVSCSFLDGHFLGATFKCQGYLGCLEKTIEGTLGSWDLEVDSLSYLVAHLEREESTDFLRQSFITLEFQALIFGFVVHLEPCGQWEYQLDLLRFYSQDYA